MSERREQENVDPPADGDPSVHDLPGRHPNGSAAVRGGASATTKPTVSEFTIKKSTDSSSP